MQKKIIIWVAAFFIMVNVTLVMFVVFSEQGKPAKVKLPVPNGYDDFVAGAMRVSGDLRGYATNSREQLAVTVSNNAESLRLLTRGVGEECRVPVEYTTNFINSIMPQLQTFKNAAFLICSEARLAELEGRTNDAIKSYLNGVRFGQELSRGGLVISRLVGVACESIAVAKLGDLTVTLEATNCRAVATALEAIDSREEPVSETIQRDREWGRMSSGFSGRLASLFMAKSLNASVDAVTAKFMANTLRRRELILKAAGRAYELENGKPAKAVSDLAPTYLKAIPKDPTTDKELLMPR